MLVRAVTAALFEGRDTARDDAAAAPADATAGLEESGAALCCAAIKWGDALTTVPPGAFAVGAGADVVLARRCGADFLSEVAGL